MIQNPTVAAFRYDPYAKSLTREGYDVDTMKSNRRKCIAVAQCAQTFGLILGTLGRQGNLAVFKRMKEMLRQQGKTVVPFLMAEISVAKLNQISGIEVRGQYMTLVACNSRPGALQYLSKLLIG